MAKKKDLWPQLCNLVSVDDGQPTRDSGLWAEDKLYFWSRYIDIATSGMVNKWPEGLVYLDLFAGPGICSIRHTNRRVLGSPLIAAHAAIPFRKILLCELDQANASACEQRLKQSPAAALFKVFCGDCNDRIDEIISEIPHGSLTLAFLDPTGLHAELETIRKLSKAGRVDC